MDIPAELERLADLHRSGALTDDEFTAAKAAVLAGDHAPGPVAFGEVAGAAASDADSDAGAGAGGTAVAAPPAQSILQQQLDEMKLENAVARLDREWELEREKYSVVDNTSGGYPLRYRPTQGGSLASGIAVTVFGVIWTVIAFTATSAASGFGGGGGSFGIVGLFPIFGIVFILFGIWSSYNGYTKAGDYDVAEKDYQHRRAQLLAGRPERRSD